MDGSHARPVSVVAGGTGGIGRAVAEFLDGQGHRVVVCGRSREKLQRLGIEQNWETRLVDAASPGSIQNALIEISERCGPISGIVNCIGSILLKPAHRTSRAEFEEVLRINLHSAFELVQAAGTCLREQGGSVVLMSTAAARIGIPNHEAIAAAKAGVEGLARSAAATYAGQGIRFNVVAPGLVRTELSRGLWESEAAAQMSQDMHPLGRLGEPEDVASLIAWLLDPGHTWITGQVIGIDGGLASLTQRQRRSATK